MAYFNILQISSPEQITYNDEKKDTGEITYALHRFLEYTDSNIKSYFEDLDQDKINILKKYPALITFEKFEHEIILAKLQNIIINKKNQTITTQFKIYHKENPPESNTTKLFGIGFEKKERIEKLSNILKYKNGEIYRNHWALKSGNIFDKDKNSLDFSNHQYLFKNYKDKISYKQDILPVGFQSGFTSEATLTISEPAKIKNTAEYINKVFELIKEFDDDSEVFFRGHSNVDYKLTPSLLRDFGDRGKIYERSEQNSFMNLLSIEPLPFTSDINSFDILTRMQHYKLPTRLLDITSNPLTALFFACESKDIENDAEVIIISLRKEHICYFNSDKVSCLSNLARLSTKQKDKISETMINIEKSTPDNLIMSNNNCGTISEFKQYIQFIKNEKPYFEPEIKIEDLNSIICVRGRMNQERIVAQSGSFLLFGFVPELKKKSHGIFNIERLIIKGSEKINILQELDLLNINSRTIYPGIEKTSEYIKAKLENHAK